MDQSVRDVVSNGLKKFIPYKAFTKKNQPQAIKSDDAWSAFIDEQETMMKHKHEQIFKLYWDKSLSYAVIFPHTPEGKNKLDPLVICAISICINKILKELNGLTHDIKEHDSIQADAQQKMIYSSLKMLLKEMAIYVRIKPTQIISRLDMILVNRDLLQLLVNLCEYTQNKQLITLVENCIKSFISIDWAALYKEQHIELDTKWASEC